MKLGENMNKAWLIAVTTASVLYYPIASADPAAVDSPDERAPQTAAAAEADLGEIVVTARRRAENLQEVPISINAFSGANLEERSFRTLTDLTFASPGLRFSSEGTTYTSSVSMRGLGKNAASTTGTPSVVVYFAEVPIPGDNLNVPTYDMKDIEVLKGPQGTLFGRNAIGGAILLTPQEPSFDLGGYVRATYGNLDYKAIEGALNVPLVADTLALRIAAQSRRRDGYVYDTTYGESLDDVHQDSVRISLLFKPTDAIRNTLIFDNFTANEAGNGYVLFRVNELPGLEVLNPSLQAALAAERAGNFRTTASAVPDPYTKADFWGVTNTTSIALDAVLFKNIFGYRVNDIRIRGNFDGLPPLFGDQAALYKTLASKNDHRSVTDEFQMQGNWKTIGLDYILGAFYAKVDPNGVNGITNREFDFFGSAPLTAVSNYSSVTSKALFGQVGYDLSTILPRVKLNAGMRYTWTDTEVCGATKVAPATPGAFYSADDCRALAAAGLNSILTKSESKPTWTIGLDFQATDDVLLYVASRRGYREGGINTPLFNSPNTTGHPIVPGAKSIDLRPYQTYNAETLTDVEVGIKSQFRAGDMKGTLNVAGYHSWYKGAVQYISVAGLIDQDSGFPYAGSFGYNSGNLSFTGIELDSSLTPIHDLTVSVSASWLNQKIDEVNTVPPFSTPSITLPSPKWSASAAVDYILPVHAPGGDVVLHGDHSLLGDYQVQGTGVPGYQLTNFRLDWRDIGHSKVSAGLFVKNALNKLYIAGPSLVLRQFPSNAVIFGEPRAYGLELTYRF
jgi:iron complex outermembrane receptor protein